MGQFSSVIPKSKAHKTNPFVGAFQPESILCSHCVRTLEDMRKCTLLKIAAFALLLLVGGGCKIAAMRMGESSYESRMTSGMILQPSSRCDDWNHVLETTNDVLEIFVCVICLI